MVIEVIIGFIWLYVIANILYSIGDWARTIINRPAERRRESKDEFLTLVLKLGLGDPEDYPRKRGRPPFRH